MTQAHPLQPEAGRSREAAGPFSEAADHLLRTFAAVPVGQRVLELGGSRYGLAGPLTQLGFDVHVCSTDVAEVTAAQVHDDPRTTHRDPDPAARFA